MSGSQIRGGANRSTSQGENVGSSRPRPAAKKFARAYRHQYGTAPALYSAEAYDATNAAIRAIKNAVSNGGAHSPGRQHALRSVNLTGISTRVAFARNGNIAPRAAKVNLFQDRKGAFIEVGDIRQLPG